MRLPAALLLAVLRSLPGPVFFPVRLLATIYVDLFRALPGLLVIFVLETILLPLAFLWLFAEGLKKVAARL